MCESFLGNARTFPPHTHTRHPCAPGVPCPSSHLRLLKGSMAVLVVGAATTRAHWFRKLACSTPMKTVAGSRLTAWVLMHCVLGTRHHLLSCIFWWSIDRSHILHVIPLVLLAGDIERKTVNKNVGQVQKSILVSILLTEFARADIAAILALCDCKKAPASVSKLCALGMSLIVSAIAWVISTWLSRAVRKSSKSLVMSAKGGCVGNEFSCSGIC